MDAITLEGVTKHFKKRTIKPQHTTLKSELVRWITGRNKSKNPSMYIEALKGVDLSIPKGRTVGIIGRNGSGKSTLLKLITGIYTPTSGTVKVNGRISALLELGAGFHPEFSGRENIMINGIILAMSAREVRSRVDEIIEFAELGDFIDEPVRAYSSGMFMRLAFAVATHVDPEVLIIDEILAVGDEHFAKRSAAKMNEFKRAGKTIVVVTHDLGTVREWCDTVAWIDGGKARLVGDPALVVDQYREAVAKAEAESESTGHSALSSPGTALPSLPAVNPASELRLGAVSIRPKDRTASTAEPAELEIEFTARAPVNDLVVSMRLKRDGGPIVYALVAGPREFGVAALRGSGKVVLHLPRLSLTPGRYNVDVFADTTTGNPYDHLRNICSFDVTGIAAEGGLVDPVHRWSLELDEAAQPVSSSATRR
ncbi:MAG: ABC transporter ATP-binding protein [Myxococcaceae bacterium]